ncbi:hypothetical protein SAMD00019534_021180, partial [Acytostelium subglobosum LB1]|uniref:hypothetical protein n=1 Tax=Acytostelium subglobosum LB1 TaxID=1410327 RepID=UPI0006449090
TDEILFEQKGKSMNITLNRPKALNALNQSMVKTLTPMYRQWHTLRDGDGVIIMKGAGEKAFCAGGDIRAIYDGSRPSVLKTGQEPDDSFFTEEYTLNNLIGTSPIPQVSLYNGITMGGGVGLSVHGKFRVATDNTMFAMPETGIGFFCDVGGSHFLPRLPHNTGMYLGLTGAKLKGKDCFVAGVATHYVPIGKMTELQKTLENMSNPTAANVADVLSTFHEKVDINDANTISNKFEQFDRIFSKGSVEEIVAALEKDGSEWAKQTIAVLNTMSPTALKVVHRQIINGSKLPNLAECLKMEMRMAATFVRNNDFFEGVRALLVDKDKNPKWQPATLSQVTDAMVNKYFEPLSKSKELNI